MTDNESFSGVARQRAQPGVLRVLGCSGSGKTTFIDWLIGKLPALRIGVIKHTRHNLNFPEPRYDTGKHLQSGARFSIGIAPNGSEMFSSDASFDISESLDFLGSRVDLVILEGARHFPADTILLGEIPKESVLGGSLLSLPSRAIEYSRSNPSLRRYFSFLAAKLPEFSRIETQFL